MHGDIDAHCCRMGTAIKHPVPEQVKSSFVIFDILTFCCIQAPVNPVTATCLIYLALGNYIALATCWKYPA